MHYLKTECQKRMQLQYFEDKAKLNRLRTKIKDKHKKKYRVVRVSKKIRIVYDLEEKQIEE